MSYLLEALGEDRFQAMCQSLIAKEFRGVQALPLRQPDGGRDAYVSQRMDSNRDEGIIVFQVKYVRKPHSINNPHRWLVDILKDEAPKIDKLIPRGARSFYLVTNVLGTGHLETGSIDTLQGILDEHISIPAQCWWRDDIERRLDGSTDIKWSYPEILSGSDVLRHIVEQGLAEHAQRRTNAVKAFLVAQYDADRDVKFQQVDLQNDLLSLFVDVPALRGTSRADWFARLNARSHTRYLMEHDDYPVGAAAILLGINSSAPDQLVLQGAPGQGKSTVTQYVCQVHRLRLLSKEEDLAKVPEDLVPTDSWIPIRVELRDYATWLDRKNPFSALGDSDIPEGWQPSIESYLSAMIGHLSGGFEFSVSDLHAVAQLSSILLVLDGFDEVADIGLRHRIVDEIETGIRRLRATAAALRVVITSRPAAFENSPGFSEKSFPHIVLEDLSQTKVMEYANKWILARRIEGKTASGIRAILRSRLEQPHLRDLARNPMQLAILLNLIHTRGSSLPDKRTALYDQYVDLFLNREAEKSESVREHRDLLVAIHGYLAWTIHAEVEKGKHNGSVSVARIEACVRGYLKSEGRELAIADDLFAGLVERVVFLVGRREGTLEFEVQPLREYFAARHLYDLAPYSPAGNEHRGTLPERFMALASNFYWLNVTRFFAGYYSRGELPSLVDCLEQLAEDDDYRLISHAQQLTGMLLSDWVFAQDQRTLRRAISIALSGLGSRQIQGGHLLPRARSTETLRLPETAGGKELVEECFRILHSGVARDLAAEICRLAVANSSVDHRKNSWVEKAVLQKPERVGYWFFVGLHLGVLNALTESELDDIFDVVSTCDDALIQLVRAGQADYVQSSKERLAATVKILLRWYGVSTLRTRRSHAAIIQFAHSIEPLRYLDRRDLFLSQGISDGAWPDGEFDAKDSTDWAGILSKCETLIDLSNKLIRDESLDWSTQIQPWDTLVEELRRLFGESWSASVLANSSAAIRSSHETGAGHNILVDDSLSLCRRARYARLRSGSPQWWIRQFESVEEPYHRMLASLLYLSWASDKTIDSTIETVQKAFSGMTDAEWQSVIEGIGIAQTVVFLMGGRPRPIGVPSLDRRLNSRAASAIGIRVKPQDARVVYDRYLKSYRGNDRSVLQFCQNLAFEIAIQGNESWKHTLPLISKCYSRGIALDPTSVSFSYRLSRSDNDLLPLEVAKEIATFPSSYPRILVELADDRCRRDVQTRVRAVGDIAAEDDWAV